MEQERLVYTVEEASKLLHVSRGLLYGMAREGRLPGMIRLGSRRILISRKVLDEFLNGSGNKTTT